MSPIQRALRECAETKVTPLTPHWPDTARRLMRQAADALDAAEEAMAASQSPAVVAGKEQAEPIYAHSVVVRLATQMGMVFKQVGPQPLKFPIMLRKMWSGDEVQKWLNAHQAHGIVGEAPSKPPVQGSGQ